MNDYLRAVFTDLYGSRYVLSAYCYLQTKKKREKKKKERERLKAASFSLQDTGQYLYTLCISIYEERDAFV